MRPVEALDRVVYLLDRTLAESRKVRAFGRAREVATEVGDDELVRRRADGTLTELAGIGPVTAAIITEAIDGEVPSYLAELEDKTVLPLGEGAELRAALKGDCHSHSLWSDGGAPIETMARTAQELGHEYLVMTDHSPRLTIAHGLTAKRLKEQLEEIRALNEKLAPFRILTGIEVDILPDGSLDQSEEMLSQLDVVVASVHSKLRMPRQEMTRRMVLALANPHVDILGHCTGRKVVGTGRPQSQFDPEIVFAACKRFDVALEINCRPERQDPPEDLLEMAIEWGLDFSIDTDAHAPGQLEWQVYGCDKATRFGIPADRVVNTRGADDLVAWTGSNPL
ncbi:MAG TPA: PHP domain-containing protein [Acidimicrobiales bacterium]|jgi:putative hydrolase|nr:PHP domain-containing protein [Acidimicrobiales bacterium]